jgi:hypothetical protein
VSLSLDAGKKRSWNSQAYILETIP